MTDDERFERWVADIQRITHEVYAMNHYRALWRELAKITQSANLPASVFFDALTSWYTRTQCLAARRQLDADKDSRSLYRLISDLRSFPSVMTRSRHVDLWGDDPWFQRDGNRNFDLFASDTNPDELDPAQLDEDLAKLDRTGRIVKKYVNKTLAHTDLAPAPAVPTFEDMNEIVDVIGDLTKKYTSLLQAAILAELAPIIEDDWTAIFRTAWLK